MIRLNPDKCIRITCYTEVECVEVQKYLFKKGYTWVDRRNSIFYFRPDEYPKNLYCNFLNEKYTICHGMKFKTEEEAVVKIYTTAKLILRKYKLEKLGELGDRL